MKKVIAAVAVVASAFVSYGFADAKPCAKHTDTTAVTEAQCAKAYKARAKRDKVKWPTNPTTRDLVCVA